ncbi:MAG: hypothetical protein DRQ88_08010 [Epsilonproteobacteria bacterium]|nr:MAG: hypothetical protein DRQ89_05595 [Campylobacterota bacterium]RLA66067.1 MAG: hypothetical protein DRQ88_08010 [Campylobacterota bacterium]
MAQSIYWIEILLAIAVVTLMARVGYLTFKMHEQHLEAKKESMQEEYEHALENFIQHPHDHKAKEDAYKKGDAYFKLKIPDYFEYPLPDFDTHIDYIDNRKVRKELVQKDIDKKMHEGHHKMAA